MGILSQTDEAEGVAPRATDSSRWGKQDRLGWIVFGGSIAVVLGFVAAAVMLPHQGVRYCTADFGTCIINRSRSDTWRVLDTQCPAGQSLRFVALGGMQIRRCHSIAVSGFPAPLNACPAACAK